MSDTSNKITLLNRAAKPQEFTIPAGWVHKTEGFAKRGDRWWNWGSESWQPINEHAFLGNPVKLLQAVITRDGERTSGH